MEIGPTGRRKELILFDQNFNTTLINSTSREMFTMIRLINYSIPKNAHCPLKCEDNLATHPFETLSHDLVGFTIGINFFLRSSSVADLNGEEKLDGEEDTSPRECANSNQRKGEKTCTTKQKVISKPVQVKER